MRRRTRRATVGWRLNRWQPRGRAPLVDPGEVLDDGLRIFTQIIRGVSTDHPSQPDQHSIASTIACECAPRAVVFPSIEFGTQLYFRPGDVDFGDVPPAVNHLAV